MILCTDTLEHKSLITFYKFSITGNLNVELSMTEEKSGNIKNMILTQGEKGMMIKLSFIDGGFDYMPTVNKKLESLKLDEIEKISERYLLGWHDTMCYGFRVKGLNRKRKKFGLSELTKKWSDSYRLNYIRSQYSKEEIKSEIENYLLNNLVDKERWKGIELFDCRFGREYARLFKILLGSKEYRRISEETRVKKLKKTQINLYNGVGLGSQEIYEKATDTLQEKYGVNNAMHIPSVLDDYSSPFLNVEVYKKAVQSKLKNKEKMLEFYKKNDIIPENMFKFSSLEKIVFVNLIKKFGKSDVYYQYGIHPSDSRYPYSCDFYVKSLDLFIEVNVHWSHGGHWFDSNNHDDNLRVSHLSQFDKKSYKTAIRTWIRDDVRKRITAKKNHLNYLVFWDIKLDDFYKWFYSYDCDYKSYLLDFPKNSY